MRVLELIKLSRPGFIGVTKIKQVIQSSVPNILKNGGNKLNILNSMDNSMYRGVLLVLLAGLSLSPMGC